MKCDLHVHSVHSGTLPNPILRHFFLESYSPAQIVYSKLRERGMDLVTITDHDSIGAAEELRRHPDFFVSEEVTCRMPSGTEVHVGVYDLTERQHIEIAKRRKDLFRLLAYLSEQGLFFTINHIFSCLTGRRDVEDFAWIAEYFPGVEALNGHMLPESNDQAAQLAKRFKKIAVGGSDAHALASVGTAYTEVPGARNKDEFMAGLRAGYGKPGGQSGNYAKLTRDILMLCGEMMYEDHWTVVLAPLLALVPAIAAVNYFLDRRFIARWGAAINSKPAGNGRAIAGQQKQPAWEA
jgi:predicted metal-dependent phosphoesterase TrpH